MTEYVMQQTGIKMEHVPFKSDADVARELDADQVDFGIPVAGVAIPFAKDGKFKAIAVTGTQRLKVLTNVPTMGEEVSTLNLGVYAIYGLLAPVGTPPAVVKTLSDAFNKVPEMPDVVSRLDPMSVKPSGGARAAISAPMMLAAPPRLSMITGWPRRLPSISFTARPM